jgi:hypothetical protein
MRQIILDPYIPLGLWVPLALAAAGLWAWYALASRRRLGRRWPAVMTLMGLVLVIPLVLLLNPTWVQRIPPPAGKPLLSILVDGSASMATADAEEGQTRYAQAERLAVECARRLGDRFEIRLRTFAENSSPQSPEGLKQVKPDGAGTDLAAVVEAALDDQRAQGQAMLLLSDGIHNGPGGLAVVRQSVAKARAMAAPVYVKTLGRATEVRDLEIRLKNPQELAFPRHKVPLVVTVEQRGSLAGQCRLSLLEDGKVIDTRQASLKPNAVTEEIFQVTKQRNGLYRYEVRAEPLAGEVTPANNAAVFVLRVVDRPVRVLLLEGKPYWDTKFLVRTLAMDPSIELVSVVRLAEGRLLERKILRPEPSGAQEGTAKSATAASQPPKASPATSKEDWAIRKDVAGFLADPATLESYQIVVLGRDTDIFLTDEALVRLKKWLTESGGSLVCFRGSPSMQVSQRLGELMPVRWVPGSESRFRAQWTEAGEALRWLPSAVSEDPLVQMPSLASTARAEAAKTLAVVLASTSSGVQGEPRPVIAYQPVGSGRAVVVEGAGMWRWAFLPPEHRQHDDVYGQLWRSLVRWLIGNVGLLPHERLALKTDKVGFRTGETVTATLLTRAEQVKEVPQIELTGGDLPKPQTITPVPAGSYPGQYRVPLGRLAEGRYRIRVAGAAEDEVSGTAVFDVRANLKERLDVRAQPGVMKWIADQTGGQVLDQVEAASLARQFEQHLAKTRPERFAQTIAWDRWWVLAMTVVLWGTTWGLRRWSGLV